MPPLGIRQPPCNPESGLTQTAVWDFLDDVLSGVKTLFNGSGTPAGRVRTRQIETQGETEALPKMAMRSVTCADAGALVYVEPVTFDGDDDVMPSVDTREINFHQSCLSTPRPGSSRLLGRVRGP
jgi:hypothetical protein